VFNLARLYVNKFRPLVSIVIPVYNAERYVGYTLDSVLKQTWRELEVIVVIDGATDCSMEVCKQFDDKRIKYVVQENGGLAAARNAGIDVARGDYIGFIDADDIWLAEKITRHMEQFDKDPDLGLSYSYSSLMDEDGKDLGTLQKEGTNPTSFQDCYVRNVIGNGSNALLRKDVFIGRETDDQAFPPMVSFDTDLRRAEDFELWSRIASLTRWKLACIPEELVRYRINMSGLSSNTKLQRHYHLLAMAKISAYAPRMAESYRTSAVAHLYWHQARTLAHQKNTRAGLQAVRHALHYNWRTITGNHFMIGAALASSVVLPRPAYFKLLRLSGHIWGWWQHLQVLFGKRKKKHVSDAVDTRQHLSTIIGKPDSYAREKAMLNLFFLSHKHQLMFLGISKNASTSLKHLMYREEFGAAEHDQVTQIHKAWGWSSTPGRGIVVGDEKSLEKFSTYSRFAVYRDPVSRFLSAYHNKVIYSPSTHPYYLENRLEGMGLDHFINVTAAILKMKNPLHIDEHLRPQSWYYQAEDVDYIVPIESLAEFLKTRFGILFESVHNKTELPWLTPNEQQVDRIKQLYACDYAIKPNWPDKDLQT
jgi:glycosyltransferase involved in cell wall biosynthesis